MPQITKYKNHKIYNKQNENINMEKSHKVGKKIHFLQQYETQKKIIEKSKKA